MTRSRQPPRNGEHNGSHSATDAAHADARWTQSKVVLHIDDDVNDSELLVAAARKANVDFQLVHLEDGESAIHYLSGQGLYSDRQRFPLPALILLDLKMPRTNGFEMLEWIRHRGEVRHIPVVILSGSELQDDIERAFAGGAKSYLIKPLGFEALVRLIRNLDAAWFSGSTPSERRG